MRIMDVITVHSSLRLFSSQVWRQASRRLDSPYVRASESPLIRLASSGPRVLGSFDEGTATAR